MARNPPPRMSLPQWFSAAQSGDAAFLTQHSAKLAGQRDFQSYTALMIAVKHQQQNAVLALLPFEAGLRNSFGDTAFCMAVRQKNFEAAEALFDHEYDQEAGDSLLVMRHYTGDQPMFEKLNKLYKENSPALDDIFSGNYRIVNPTPKRLMLRLQALLVGRACEGLRVVLEPSDAMIHSMQENRKDREDLHQKIQDLSATCAQLEAMQIQKSQDDNLLSERDREIRLVQTEFELCKQQLYEKDAKIDDLLRRISDLESRDNSKEPQPQAPSDFQEERTAQCHTDKERSSPTERSNAVCTPGSVVQCAQKEVVGPSDIRKSQPESRPEQKQSGKQRATKENPKTQTGQNKKNVTQQVSAPANLDVQTPVHVTLDPRQMILAKGKSADNRFKQPALFLTVIIAVAIPIFWALRFL